MEPNFKREVVGSAGRAARAPSGVAIFLHTPKAREQLVELGG
ncbi:hypothetical protein [Cupriavidus metallidurans]|nr:hypothetical protein [Cupriavidus metallidurans]